MSRRKNRRTAETRRPPTPSIIVQDMADIRPYDNNPRDNAAAIESVANSIQSFGFLVPIVVDRENVIVAGHTRYEASIRLGLTEVPTVVADHLTQDQINAFRLIDNKVSELARWDMDMLADEITLLQNTGINLIEYGWTEEEIDCLSSVVAEDCLSAANVTAVENQRHRARVEQRAPNRTRLVIGEFIIFIDSEVYREWASTIRAEHDYDKNQIHARLKTLLGITPYEQAHNGETIQ